MNFHFVHEFDIDVAGYWKVFLSEPFNQDLYRELKMKSRRVIETTDDGKIFRRVQQLEPTTPVPGFLQSIVKDTGYTESDVLDWAKNTMEVMITTPMFKDRFQMRGLYVVTPLGDGRRCRREFKGEVRVSVPLLGGKIEKYMMEQLRDAYEVAARVTRKWISQPGAS